MLLSERMSEFRSNSKYRHADGAARPSFGGENPEIVVALKYLNACKLRRKKIKLKEFHNEHWVLNVRDFRFMDLQKSDLKLVELSVFKDSRMGECLFSLFN